MKLENQVVSLELAKKMKELGFEQDSLFSFYLNKVKDKVYISETFMITRKEEVDYICSAYTVAELGEMLKGSEWKKDLQGFPKPTIGGYWRVDLDDEGMLCSEKTEADARAKMLIYLKENNLI